MDSFISFFKSVVARVCNVLKPIDIGFLKMCCVSFGVLLAGLFPAITRGRRKLFWALLFFASLVPIASMMVRALSPMFHKIEK
ncbi:MAG: hypothetical protein RSC43_06100 [Clostridia bacterium]